MAIDQTLDFAMRFGLCPPNPILQTIKATMEQAADIRTDLLAAPALFIAGGPQLRSDGLAPN